MNHKPPKLHTDQVRTGCVRHSVRSKVKTFHSRFSASSKGGGLLLQEPWEVEAASPQVTAYLECTGDLGGRHVRLEIRVWGQRSDSLR